MAARLARLARSRYPSLGLLRSAVTVTVACPVPDAILQVLKTDLRRDLRTLPGGVRQPSYTIAVRASSVGWGKSPFVEGVLAPPLSRLGDLGACSCAHIPGPRFEGHLVTRDWQVTPCCGMLQALCGYESLAQRTYPSLPSLLKTTTERVSRVLKQAGCPKDVRDVLTSAVLAR